MLKLYVKHIARPGIAHLFVEEAENFGVAAKIRSETGCLKYDYYFSAADENVVLLIEQWVKPEDQQMHMTQPHMETLRALRTDMWRPLFW